VQQHAPLTPPTEAEGTVTFDVVDGPAQVDLITHRPLLHLVRSSNVYDASEHGVARPLCQTPCTVNLPSGYHQVQFSHSSPGTGRESLGYVQVGTRPVVVRHALGQFQHAARAESLWGMTAFVGILTFVVGGLLLPISECPGEGGVRPVALTLVGGGALLSLASWWGFWSARPTVQPGATTQWTP